MIVGLSECFNPLINGGSFAMDLALRISFLSWARLESVRDEASRLGCLLRGPVWGSVLAPMDLLPMGVVFFPSLPFIGVMLSPSFVLEGASGEGGTSSVPLSLFSPLLSLPLLSSPSPSLSFSLLFSLLFFPVSFSLSPFLHKLFPSLSSSPLFYLVFLSSFSLEGFFPSFFFFKGTACTVCLRNVRSDATDCNHLYLFCNKEMCYFLNLEFCAF